MPDKFYEVSINNNNNNEEERKEKKKLEAEGKQTSKTPWKSIAAQALASSAKNLLLFQVGIFVGLPTIAIPALSHAETHVPDPYLHLTRTQISWFSSINLICVPLGCLVSGKFTQPFGRKKSMIFMNIPYAISFLLFAFSRNVTTLYFGLILCGLTGGLLEAPVLTYVAEITQPNLRGVLSAVASVSVLVGSCSQLLLGSFLNWRTIALIDLIFPIMSTTILFFIPESPHWLITKGRIDDAEKSFCWLRGWISPSEVQQELKQTVKSIEISKGKKFDKDGNAKANYKMYLRRTFILPYIIITYVFFVGMIGGSSPILINAVAIFEEIESPVDSYIAALLFGICQILGSTFCVCCIHYTGKRPLTAVSTGGAAVCLFIVGLYVQYHKEYSLNMPIIPFLAVLSFSFLIFIAIRILPWMLIGEIFPNNIRATASGLAASSAYIFLFIINKIYFPMKDLMSLSGLFYFYGLINLLGCIILYIIMPETEGVTLYDIEQHFEDKSKTFVTKIDKTDQKYKIAGVDNYGMEKNDEKC